MRPASRLLAVSVLLFQTSIIAVFFAAVPARGVSLWSNSATPDEASYGGGNYELGVSFTSDVAGTITALRFYKSPMDTNPHVGNLWTSSGTLLASVPFSNESASGWQQVSLPTPITIQPGQVYVASYSETSGYYPVSWGYFTSAQNSPPLHAPADGTVARNGVFSPTPGTFPNQSDGSTNYWVDVVFNPSSGSTGSNVSSSNTGGSGDTLWPNSATPNDPSYGGGAYELGVSFTSDVAGTITALRFYKSPMDTNPHVGNLWTSSGTLLASVPFSNESASGWQQVSLPTPITIQAGQVYIASYSETSGYYPVSRGYFANAQNSPPLHAPADGTVASNGVFSYTPGKFPNQTYDSTNYWVDVVFQPASGAASAGTLSISPSSLAFGDLRVGNSSVLPIVLSNTGGAAITISQVTESGAGFSVSAPSLPFNLAPGNKVSLSVTFEPTNGGSASGSITISSDSTGSPSLVSLSGTGLISHSVALSWSASPSAGVIGYNVYRSSSSGGPYTKINSSLISGLSYTDGTVQSGDTYYYCSTAVNSSGLESGYSNSVEAVIPSP